MKNADGRLDKIVHGGYCTAIAHRHLFIQVLAEKTESRCQFKCSITVNSGKAVWKREELPNNSVTKQKVEEKDHYFLAFIWALGLKAPPSREGPVFYYSMVGREEKMSGYSPCPGYFQAATDGGQLLCSDPPSGVIT